MATTDPNSPSYANFLNTVTRFGLSKLYKFRISDIGPLPSDLSFPGGPNSGIILLISALSLPGRKINTTTVPYKAFEFNVPTNAAYPDNQSWSITVLQDKNLLIREFFERWSEKTYDIQNNTQNFVNTNIHFDVYEEQLAEGNKPFSYKDYVLRNNVAKIEQYTLRKYTLHGAYPVMIGGIQYNYSDPGTTFASFNVTFAYQYYTSIKGAEPKLQPGGNLAPSPQSSTSSSSTTQPDNSTSNGTVPSMTNFLAR